MAAVLKIAVLKKNRGFESHRFLSLSTCEGAMKKPDDPYARVRENSPEHVTLTLVGWLITDRVEEWLHMEPPLKKQPKQIENLTTDTSEK